MARVEATLPMPHNLKKEVVCVWIKIELTTNIKHIGLASERLPRREGTKDRG
jgi:hypothetical protein